MTNIVYPNETDLSIARAMADQAEYLFPEVFKTDVDAPAKPKGRYDEWTGEFIPDPEDETTRVVAPSLGVFSGHTESLALTPQDALIGLTPSRGFVPVVPRKKSKTQLGNPPRMVDKAIVLVHPIYPAVYRQYRGEDPSYQLILAKYARGMR